MNTYTFATKAIEKLTKSMIYSFKQTKPNQTKTKQNKTKQNKTKQNKTKQTKPNQTKPKQTTKHSQIGMNLVKKLLLQVFLKYLLRVCFCTWYHRRTCLLVHCFFVYSKSPHFPSPVHTSLRPCCYQNPFEFKHQ